jgi:folate/biopterin transporter
LPLQQADNASMPEASTTTTSNTPLVATTTTQKSNNHNPLKSLIPERIFLGIEPTPEIVAIVTVYFVQGALGLARLAKTYLLKDELQLGPAELSALTGLFALPWTIKPVYGFLSDGFPLWGYRRKTYLMAAGILGSASYAVLGWSNFWDSLSSHLPPGSVISGSVAAILLGSACVAMSDVVTDGIVVSRTRQAKNDPAIAGGLQSLCWGASATGSILSAYFSGSLLEHMSVRSVFGLTAILPLLVAFIAFQVNEEPVKVTESGVMVATSSSGSTSIEDVDDDIQNKNKDEEVLFDPTVGGEIKKQVQALWDAFRQDSIWKPALFIFLWQSTPTADGAFFFFLSNEMHFGPEFMGRVSLISSVASLAGVVLYNQYLKKVAIKDILFWSSIISVPLGLVPILLVTHVNQALGIPDEALIYGDDVVLAALGEMAFLPTLVLAAKLCPPGIEAVLFATLMSIFNGASTVGTELGAGLTKLFGITETNFDNLTALLIFCNLTSLYPLLFIGWLDHVGGDAQSEEAQN